MTEDLRFGKYTLTLSIGYANADRKDEVDLADFLSTKEWEEMSEDKRSEFLLQCAEDKFRDYIVFDYSPK